MALDLRLAQQLMTLAGIAYGEPSAISGYLAGDAPTGGDWEPFWLAEPATIPLNFAFVARSRSSGADAVAIRGAYPNPFSPAYRDDADQDNRFGDMVSWPGGEEAPAATPAAPDVTRRAAAAARPAWPSSSRRPAGCRR